MADQTVKWRRFVGGIRSGLQGEGVINETQRKEKATAKKRKRKILNWKEV